MTSEIKNIWSLIDNNNHKILRQAVQEAFFIGHYYLGVEHIFISIIKSCSQLAEFLKVIGVSPKKFRDEIRIQSGIMISENGKLLISNLAEYIRYSVKVTDSDDLEEKLKEYQDNCFGQQNPEAMFITPRLQSLLVKANTECIRNKKEKISIRELLLALLSETESLPIIVLRSYNKGADRKLEEWAKEWISEDIKVKQPEKSPRKKDKQISPLNILNEYGRDLTRLAQEGELHAAIGRKNELRQIARILCQRETNNPLLIGGAGVGKTAIVEGFAYRLAQENVIPEMKDKRIVELQISSLIAGSKYRGDLEKRARSVLDEVKNNPNVIIFIDEIHTIMSSDTSQDLSNILKPALARGDFPCIGSTTIAEYRRNIEKDPALARRFECIYVEEPNQEDCIKILNGLRPILEEHHKLRIFDSAIKAAVNLSQKYIVETNLPAKAVKLLERACTTFRLPSLTDMEKQKENQVSITIGVNDEIIRRVLSEMTGIPINKLTGEQRDHLKNMENILASKVIGQDEAVNSVSKRIKVTYAGLKDEKRPIGVFLFVGPTGVGKTALAKALAGFLFGSEERIIRLDMSEYMEKHNVAKLIGSPPGYIGYEEEGQLTGKLRTYPHSLVLLDEVEKAHEDVYNIFLQLFDEGRLTDNKGKTIDAKNAVFIMTSNIGADVFQKGEIAGFEINQNKERLCQEIESRIRKKFKPEFLNRIDLIVHFFPLDNKALNKIFDLQLKPFQENLKKKNISIGISDEARNFICQQGYDPAYGARPLRRAIENLLIQPLGDILIQREISSGTIVKVNISENKINFELSLS